MRHRSFSMSHLITFQSNLITFFLHLSYIYLYIQRFTKPRLSSKAETRTSQNTQKSRNSLRKETGWQHWCIIVCNEELWQSSKKVFKKGNPPADPNKDKTPRPCMAQYNVNTLSPARRVTKRGARARLQTGDGWLDWQLFRYELCITIDRRVYFRSPWCVAGGCLLIRFSTACKYSSEVKKSKRCIIDFVAECACARCFVIWIWVCLN